MPFRKRTEPLAPELAEAWAGFKQVFWQAIEAPLMRLVRWTDRLARWLKM
jgi:hypothetical protein